MSGSIRIDEDTYTTVGGYVLGRIGRRARVGDTLDIAGRKMKVMAVDGLRIAKVLLSPKAEPSNQSRASTRDDEA